VTRQMPPTTTYTIVGMTKYGARSWNENLYFHNDFLTDQETVAKSYFGSNYGANYVQLEVEASDTVNDRKINLSFHGKVVMDDTLSDNEIIVPVDIGQELAYGLQMDPEVTPDWTDDVTFQLLSKTNFYDDEMSITLLVENDEDEEIMEQRTYVSEAIYNALIPDEYYQISVMVEDSYDATIVMTQLELQGYNTIYPSDVTDMYGQIIQLIQTIYFGFLMGFLMVIIYFISYIVLRNVQNAKKKDYLVFRSIGASKKALNRVTIFELIMTMILAYVLTVGFFILNQYINTFIPNYLRYFKWTTYLAIFTILVLLAVLLGNRFNKKIFSRSVITALKQE
ncbi:MAG: ABC transporter permease, partial [Candidatus Izimaplasma sp.]|nr:ABC transporter permease [Candidatus Izimaplasma bacterium]